MRYFFDLMEDAGLTKDSEGQEFANADEMHIKAHAILAEIAAEMKPSDHRVNLATQVRDAQGNAVYEANLLIEGKELAQ